MKKILAAVISFCVLTSAIFAGDVATFVDGGFSSDGKTYVFGQYGKTDKSFQGWAELIKVDIEKNDYVDGGYFSTKPSAVTKAKNGKDVYDSLVGTNYYSLAKLNLLETKPDQILYICEEPYKKGEDEINYTDFLNSDIDNPNSYKINIVPTVNGSGSKAKSSFYINVEKRDANGNVIARQKVGNPDIVRKGITGYKIEKIICDKTGKNLIFVVEKQMEDSTGLNIRYMVEACILNPDFFKPTPAPASTPSTSYPRDVENAK